MRIAAGTLAGRVVTSVSDRMGRFCWYTFQGKRDEGIIFITAYRACKDSNLGPLKAYRAQYMTLRQEDVKKPNPRKDLISALTELIETKRQEKYRPVIMMDANGDYTRPNGDKDLHDFIQRTDLVDHYKEKFLVHICTFIRESK